MNIHDGHRKRLRDRVESQGFESLSKYEQLEYLLFFCLPYRNTNVIAHKLIEKFHTLSGVLNATKEELMDIDYIGEAVASYLVTLKQVAKIYMTETANVGNRLQTRHDAINYIQNCVKYNGGIEEVFIILSNSNFKILAVEKISSGNENSCYVPLDKVLKIILKYSPTYVFLAHNHPSNNLKPSQQDITFTNELISMLSHLKITFADHIIVSNSSTDYFSFYKENLIE